MHDLIVIRCTPMAPWAWYDYVSNSGRNVMNHWLNREVPRGARDDVEAQIDVSIDIADALDDLTASARFTALAGQHAGIIEMRFKVSRVLYRPLLCAGPGESDLTLLIGARKQNGNWTPHNARNTAVERLGQIHEEGRVIEHGSEPEVDNQGA